MTDGREAKIASKLLLWNSVLCARPSIDPSIECLTEQATAVDFGDSAGGSTKVTGATMYTKYGTASVNIGLGWYLGNAVISYLKYFVRSCQVTSVMPAITSPLMEYIAS